MKFNIETLTPVKKMFHIEIDKNDVKKALDDAYSELKKTAKIKGFRIGKTPRSILERLYKKNVHKDISSQLIQNGLSEALRKSELKFVGSKNIDPPELKPTESYCFKAEIDIKPNIKEIEYKGLILEKTLYRVTDEEIDAQLHMLQKNIAKKESLKENRPIKNGDFINIEYEGFKNHIPFEEAGKSKNFTMKVGSGTITKDFDAHIEGMNINEEKEFTITFPANHHNVKLINLEIAFKVKIKDIREEILPIINDDMAKQLGPFENLKDLKNKISENLTQGYEKRKEQELNEQIFAQLIEKTEFELPETLVQYELDAIITEAEKSFQYHNKSLEDANLTREILENQYENVAKKQVRRQLILSQIIEQEKMTISDEELEKGFKDISSTYNSPIEQIKTFYQQNPDKLESFKHALLEKRTIDIIISKSDIKEIKPELLQQKKT